MKELLAMFATRQIVALKSVFDIPAMMIEALKVFDFKRMGALIVALFQLLGAFILDTPNSKI